MDSREANVRPFVVMCALIASLGTMNSGINTSALNIPGGKVRYCDGVPEGVQTFYAHSSVLPKCLPMGGWVWGTTTGMFAIGGLLGAMISDPLATKFGRRDSMIMINCWFYVGAIFLSCSVNSTMFALGRMFVGIGSGFMTCVVSLYISEISPPKARGALTSVLQLMTVIGILIIEAISLACISAVGWRVITIVTIVPTTIQMIVLPFSARSPRWLISRDRVDEARVEFLRLRNGDIEAEFADMVLSASGQQDTKSPDQDEDKSGNFSGEPDQGVNAEQQPLNLIQIMRIPVMARLTCIILSIHALSQLTGINAVMYYSTTIFENSYGNTAKFYTLGTAAANLFITICGLVLIDRLGRKTLLLISTAGMTLFCVLMVIGMKYNVAALQVVSIYLYVCSFAIGFGMVPFVLMAEVYPTYAVGATSSAALAINWLCNFVIGLIFPSMLSGMTSYTFIVFACLAAAAFFIVLLFVPETKQRSIDELGRILGWYGLDVDSYINKDKRRARKAAEGPNGPSSQHFWQKNHDDNIELEPATAQ